MSRSFRVACLAAAALGMAACSPYPNYTTYVSPDGTVAAVQPNIPSPDCPQGVITNQVGGAQSDMQCAHPSAQ